MGGVALTGLAGTGLVSWGVVVAASHPRLPWWPLVPLGIATAVGLGVLFGRVGVGRPPDALEAWLGERIEAQARLAYERPVQGDPWYFEQMSRWDVENADPRVPADQQMLSPQLEAEYRAYKRDPSAGRFDGVAPPHGTAEYDAYFARRVGWLNLTRKRLRRRRRFGRGA
jgi:hypothetical protein